MNGAQGNAGKHGENSKRSMVSTKQNSNGTMPLASSVRDADRFMLFRRSRSSHVQNGGSQRPTNPTARNREDGSKRLKRAGYLGTATWTEKKQSGIFVCSKYVNRHQVEERGVAT
jgi:hypothetical protein